MIHSDEKRRLFQLVYGVAECAQLRAGPIVPREQNDAADAGVAEYLDLALIELAARDANHERTGIHGRVGEFCASFDATAQPRFRPSDAASRRPVSPTVHGTA